VETRIGNKGRITLPLKLGRLQGPKEGDSLTIDVSGDAIIIKPKGASVNETWGIVQLSKIEIDEVEAALGREN